jgi:cytochrome c553
MSKAIWAARAGAALAVSVIALAGVGMARFEANSGRVHRIAESTLQVRDSAERVERGRHLALGLAGCGECHGARLEGRVMIDSPLMRVTAPNLTRGAGSVVLGYAERDWARTLQHGVGRDGHNLLIMPARELRKLSDDDLAAIVSFVRSRPPVDHRLEPSRVTPLGRAVLGLAGAELWSANRFAHDQPRAARATPAGATVEHGRYLIEMCRGCHGDNLKGGEKHGQDAPPSADISPTVMANWSLAQFEQLARHGKRRDGSKVNPAMPWPVLSNLSDDELRAMWLALRP